MAQRSVTASPEWVALQDHHKQAKEWHMRDLFEADPKRFEKFRSVPILTHDILLSGIIIHNFNNLCTSEDAWLHAES